MNAAMEDRAGAREVAVSRRGNWLTVRQPVAAIANHSAADLLRLTSCLQIPLRYARTPDGVMLYGDWPLIDEPDDIPRAQRRLLQQLQGEGRSQTVPEPPQIEEALAQICEASLRDEVWVVPASERWPAELQIRAVPGGVRVAAAVMKMPAAADSHVHRALAEFLCQAQASLRYARAECEGQIGCVTEITTEVLQSHLPIAMEAVAVGWRLIARETRALGDAKLAQCYLETSAGASAPVVKH